MKRFTLLTLAMLLVAIGVKAKTTETTLWEDEYSGSIELNQETVSAFNEGDVLRIYVTVPDGGANFKICYKGDGNGWVEKEIPSINNQWPWVNGGETKYDIKLTSDDITALSGMNIYISKGDNSTINKISKLVEESSEEGTPTEVWSGSVALGDWANFEDLRYDGKGALANAKIGDDIRITFTNTSDGCQLYVCDAASYVEFAGGYFEPSASVEAQTINFNITNAAILESIQQKGIVLKGKLTTLTKVELVTYISSYDAVPLTIGSDGIATFGSSKNLDFSGISGVTPYYVSEVNTGVVNLTSVSTTRAWAGYVVEGAEGEYSIPVAASEPEWIDAFNNLIYTSDYDGNWVYRSVYSDYDGGGDRETKIKTYYRYIFAKNNSDEIGFYKLAEDFTEGENPYHVIAAHKAYLETPSDITPSSSSARIVLHFDGEITSIQGVSEQTSKGNGIYYNMNGQRISKPTKGMYIMNGKKYAVK